VGVFHGGFNANVYNEYESNPSAFFPLPAGQQGDSGPAVELPLAELGAKIYSNCIGCHQASGMGNAAVPPLGGSEFVDGPEFNEKRIVAILLKGLQGPVTVTGKPFNGQMPAWESLKPRQIAGVITYVRQNFGNKGGEITEEQVKAAKKAFSSQTKPWTIEQIKEIPLDAKLEGAGSPDAAKADAKPSAPVAAKSTDAPAPVAAAGSYDLSASIANGKGIYTLSCQLCHQPTGLGLPGAFPPLAGTEFVAGDDRRLVAIVLKGIQGPIKVADKMYAAGMPQPDIMFPVLKEDKGVADVLNYVRNSFGNKSDKAITPEFVGKVRAEFASKTVQWTEQELLSFPAAK
jgi:mono/diheme cytochrome c family protein